MKESYVIIRLGDNEASEEDIAIIHAICDGNLDGQMGMPLPVGIISLIHTDRTSEQIEEVFNIIMKETDEVLPYIIFKLYDDSVKFDFCLHKISDKISFNEMKKHFEEFHGVGEAKKIWYLDDLLDRIKEVGVSGLTKEENAALQKLSENNS